MPGFGAGSPASAAAADRQPVSGTGGSGSDHGGNAVLDPVEPAGDVVEVSGDLDQLGARVLVVLVGEAHALEQVGQGDLEAALQNISLHT